MVFNVSVIGQVHRIAQAADLKCETPVRIAFSRKAVGPSVVHGKAQASCGDRSRSSRWRSRQRRRGLGVKFKLLHNNEDIYPSSDKDIEPPRLCEALGGRTDATDDGDHTGGVGYGLCAYSLSTCCPDCSFFPSCFESKIDGLFS